MRDFYNSTRGHLDGHGSKSRSFLLFKNPNSNYDYLTSSTSSASPTSTSLRGPLAISPSRTTWPETILTPRSYVGGWATMATTPSTLQNKRSGVTPRPRRMAPAMRRIPTTPPRSGNFGARRGGAYHGPCSTWLVVKTILTPRIFYRSSRQEDPENYRS